MTDTMQYRGWARYGVRGLTDQGQPQLELANAFKRELAHLHHEHHRTRISLRNQFFPALWKACVEFEISRAKHAVIAEQLAHCDMIIGGLKKQKSEARKAKTDTAIIQEQLDSANTAKKCLADERDAFKRTVVDPLHAMRHVGYQEYNARLASYNDAIKEVKKSVAGLGPNHSARKAIVLPSYPADSFEHAHQQMNANFDVAIKALGKEFQSLGLASGIRGEVTEAVSAMKFTFDRQPFTREYDSFPVQFKKDNKRGIECPTFAELSTGRQGLQLTYLGSGAGKNNDCHLYEVVQQIGNKAAPAELRYDLLVHRLWPVNARCQRWTLRMDSSKSYVTVILAQPPVVAVCDQPIYVTNDYSMGRTRPDGGINVCYFLGANINEEVFIPGWLVEKFHSIEAVDAMIDKSAGELLSSLDVSLKGNKLVTIRRLAETSASARTWLVWRDREWARRNKLHHQAINARQNIFQTAVARVAQSHTHLIEDQIELADLKRKKTRDRAEPNTLNDSVRRNNQIAAPGELRKYLRASGLIMDVRVETANSSNICPHCTHQNQPESTKNRVCESCSQKWDRDLGACIVHLARAGVVLESSAVARKTDVVTGYIASLGIKSGPKAYHHRHPSWTQSLAEVA